MEGGGRRVRGGGIRERGPHREAQPFLRLPSGPAPQPDRTPHGEHRLGRAARRRAECTPSALSAASGGREEDGGGRQPCHRGSKAPSAYRTAPQSDTSAPPSLLLEAGSLNGGHRQSRTLESYPNANHKTPTTTKLPPPWGGTGGVGVIARGAAAPAGGGGESRPARQKGRFCRPP